MVPKSKGIGASNLDILILSLVYKLNFIIDLNVCKKKKAWCIYYLWFRHPLGFLELTLCEWWEECCIYHILFIHLSINGLLDCFCSSIAVNHASVNMDVRISL